MKTSFRFTSLGLFVLLFLNYCAKPTGEAIQNQQNMSIQKTEALKALVQKFYDQLSNPNHPDADALSKVYMDENWLSTPQPMGGPGRVGLVTTLGIFGQMIPDLNWEVQEMLVDGNKVTVRSIATGTHQTDLFLGCLLMARKSLKF